MAEANQSVSDVFSFLKNEFLKEQASGVSLLKKVPDTLIFRFLDYFKSLAASEQKEFGEAIAHRSLQFFFSKDEIASSMPQASDDAFKRHFNGLLFLSKFEYTDARSLRLLATVSKSPELWENIPKPPEEFLRYATSIGPVKAAEIRKQIKRAFVQRFDAQVSNSGGGVWLYKGSFEKSDVEVEINFGGRDQLRYAVTVHSPARPIQLKRLRYELLLGAGLGFWDFLTEENLNQSIELLCEFVSYLTNLSERLPDSYCQTQTTSL
jgi:hypothetical protein